MFIGPIVFDGPHFDFDALNDEPGIFAVFSHKNEKFELVELGEAAHIREHLSLRVESEPWLEKFAAIAVAVHYTADVSEHARKVLRNIVESEIGSHQIAA